MPLQDTRLDRAGRVWVKVERRGPNDCWPWIACRRADGYGKVNLDGRVIGAHRAVWMLTHGAIPAGLHVLHRCDNPPCCNPAHLWLGTHDDNMTDRARKGRGRNPGGPVTKPTDRRAILQADQVVAIRRRYAEGGVTQDGLARAFGVSRTTISFVLSRKRWAHLT